MNLKQYEKIKSFLDENGIKITPEQLANLDYEIRKAKGGQKPFLEITEKHMYFDSSKHNEVCAILLAMALSNQQESAELRNSIITTAGYIIAHAEDINKELQIFKTYVQKVAKQVEMICNENEGKDICMPIYMNNKNQKPS